MTMSEERKPFEPLGEKGLDKLVLDGLRDFAPLEPGTLIPYEQIAEWTGRPFPYPAASRRGYVVEKFDPMGKVKMALLDQQNVLIEADPEAAAYRVLTDEEMVRAAEKEWNRSSAGLRFSALIAKSANPERLSWADRHEAEDLVRDAQEQARVLGKQMQAIRKKRKMWETAG